MSTNQTKDELRDFVKWIVIDLRSTPGIERQDFNPKALEDFVDAKTKELMELIASHTPDLTNIQHWVAKGLDPTNTNKDVPYRCLQMIADELKALSNRSKT